MKTHSLKKLQLSKKRSDGPYDLLLWWTEAIVFTANDMIKNRVLYSKAWLSKTSLVTFQFIGEVSDTHYLTLLTSICHRPTAETRQTQAHYMEIRKEKSSPFFLSIFWAYLRTPDQINLLLGWQNKHNREIVTIRFPSKSHDTIKHKAQPITLKVGWNCQ